MVSAIEAAGAIAATPGTKPATLGGVYVGPPVIQRALLYSFWDGLLANGMIALQETFAIAAAVSLSASTIAIALMSSLPLLLGSIAQFLVPMLADPAKGRKRYVLLGVRLQAIFLFVCAFTGFLPAGMAPWVYVGCFILAAVSANSTTSYWVDWMGDLIPSTVRGRHFAWRGVWFAWMHLACSLGAGLVAREYTSHNAPWSVFACILAAASLFRLGSYSFLRRQHEPVSHRVLEPFSPLKFRPGRDFLTFSMATAFFAGAAAMSGPFFTVWYLRDLHFDYFNLAVALSCTVLGSIAFVGFWGRAVDNFGTSRVLWIAGLLITVIPVPYIFFEHIQAIWLCNFYSGAVWSGYNLAVFNHLLSASDKTRRSHYIAFASLVSGVVGCAFTLLGGWLATRLPPLMGYSLRSLFLASFILRLLVCLGFFRRFREYEEALPKRSRELFLEIPGYRVGLGLFRNVFRAFRST
jgi:MFS family permease